MDTKIAVTGQCNHIVGLFLDPYIHEGGSDRLVRANEHVSVDEPFNYCPLCGRYFSMSGASTQ